MLLLDIGSALMSSGANTKRMQTTIKRISGRFGYNSELMVTHRSILLTLNDIETDQFFSSGKFSPPHGVNFKMISGISRMSWSVVDESWEIERIKEEFNRLTALPHYPRWLILVLVSLAGSAFCRLFEGSYIEMAVAFTATFAGLFIRQEATKLNFNPFLCIFFASLVSSLIAGLFVKLNIGSNPEAALSTSVLYLIPGVPLINSFSDMIDGNILNGTVRGVFGIMISFSIALGLLIAIMIYQI